MCISQRYLKTLKSSLLLIVCCKIYLMCLIFAHSLVYENILAIKTSITIVTNGAMFDIVNLYFLRFFWVEALLMGVL